LLEPSEQRIDHRFGLRYRMPISPHSGLLPIELAADLLLNHWVLEHRLAPFGLAVGGRVERASVRVAAATVPSVKGQFRHLRYANPVGCDTCGLSAGKLASAMGWTKGVAQPRKHMARKTVFWLILAAVEQPLGGALGHVARDGAFIFGASRLDDLRGFGVMVHRRSFRAVLWGKGREGGPTTSHTCLVRWCVFRNGSAVR